MPVRWGAAEARKPTHPGVRKLQIRLLPQIKLSSQQLRVLPTSDRITLPYLLGLPLKLLTGRGAIVFVRFGGPEYAAEQMPLAALAAEQTAHIFERRSLKDSQTQLEIIRQRAQFQDDFIATISHELHTPLRIYQGVHYIITSF